MSLPDKPGEDESWALKPGALILGVVRSLTLTSPKMRHPLSRAQCFARFESFPFLKLKGVANVIVGKNAYYYWELTTLFITFAIMSI